MSNAKRSSHIGAGMLVGAAIGVAAATFLQSKKGKALTKDLKRKTAALQKKVNQQLMKAGEISKESYQDLVESIMAYYVKTKDIATNEIPEVRKNLMETWKTIEKELTSVRRKR